MTSSALRSRRSVLISLLVTGAGGLCLVIGIPSGCGRGDRSIVFDVLEAFPERAVLRVVGAKVLESAPQVADADRLSEELFSHSRWSSGQAAGSLFADQVADDFEMARVIRVGGWILSQSEAMLCALVTLLEQGAHSQ